MHLTTLSPPALLGDMLLIYLCHKATEPWDRESHVRAMYALLCWMAVSKFIKLLGHYIRYPVDILLIPVSVLFGYFHGAIKIYAVVSLNVVSDLVVLWQFNPRLHSFSLFVTSTFGLCGSLRGGSGSFHLVPTGKRPRLSEARDSQG